MHRNIFIPPEGPPQEGRPNPQIYEKMGQDNIFLMLEDFYKELEHSKIRSLFPQNMQNASKKSAAFFVFLLGGPPLYQQQHGNPMMRQRHLPFVIDEAARQIWLGCFDTILIHAEEKYQFPKEHLASFRQFLDRFSLWMVNTSTEGKPENVSD
jgi:hemoglobin